MSESVKPTKGGPGDGDARRDVPLTVGEFAAFRKPAGPASARVDIEGIAVEIEGLPADLAASMHARYAPWAGPATGEGRPLRLRAVEAPLDYFLPPAFAAAWEVYRVLTAYDGAVFHATSYRLAWWFDVNRGAGQVAIAAGELDPAPRALENCLRSAVAWLAFERGGFFLHGASIVRSGRCHLFYGPSGAGKSTLSAASREGQVISDDLTLVLGTPGGLRAAGGPFRGTYTGGAPVRGLFEVAGFYRLHKDPRTFVRRGDAACFADLLGNLPWIVDQFPRHPHFIDRVRGLVAGAPFAYLHFSKDEDFWPAIDLGPQTGA
jgi:hypothetical protein